MKTLFQRLTLFAFLLVCTRLAAAETNSPTADAAPVEKAKPCFRCGGKGKFKCASPGCKDGKVECPGTCLKQDKGEWIHMEVAGHSPEEWWQKFPYEGGGGYTAFTAAHIGEAVVYQDGKATLAGPCPQCGGTTRVACSHCKGTGEITCNVCHGKGTIPEGWSENDNPTVKIRPSQFKLRDGRVLTGRILMVLGKNTTIHTDKGDVIVKSSDILSEEKPAAAK